MNSYKKILNIALPAMGENFLQMLMGMVDSYLVAHLGLIAISGVSVAGNIITIYQAIFLALGAAVASVMSKSLGEKNQDNIAYHATESLKVTLLLSALLGGASLLFGRQMISLLGTEAAVAESGGIYLSLVGGTIVLLGLMTTLGSLVRVANNPRIPMYVSLLTNVLNALFSSVAIFLFGWGIVGAALGTVLARLVGVILLWQKIQLPFAPLRWGLDRKLLNLALPAAGERLMMRAGDVVIIAIVVAFGTEAVAGNAIGETLTQFNYMPVFGVATATVMLVARSLGEGDFEQIDRLRKQSYWLSFVLMLPIALGIFFGGTLLTHLYTQDAKAVEASLSVVLFSLLGTPFTAGTVIYTAVWQGLGNGKLPFYATTIGMWVIRIGAGYLLGVTLGFGLPGVWTGTLLDNGFRWLFLSQLYRRKVGEKMTKRAFIWDLDGTLLDSYDAILAGLEETYASYQLPFDRASIKDYILKHSVQDLLVAVAEEYHLDVTDLNHRRAESLAEKNAQVLLMDGARDVLSWAKDAGIEQFVYTHKGENALVILRDLGLESFFTEILTSQSGFARKPNPEAAIYLMKKYGLHPEKIYYIGDRSLDIDFARNSQIQSINFLTSDYQDNHQMKTLRDIPSVLSLEKNL